MLLLLLFLTGCHLPIKWDDQAELSSNGYNVQHAHSCGPIAIHNALESIGYEIRAKRISKNIISHQTPEGAILRGLSHVYWEFDGITTPKEIKQSCEYYGFDVSVISGKDDELYRIFEVSLINNMHGIVLVQDDDLRYHYIAFPSGQAQNLYFDRTICDKKKPKLLKIFYLRPVYKQMQNFPSVTPTINY